MKNRYTTLIGCMLTVVLATFSACMSDDTLCVSQAEKEVLVASYLRLADLLKGVSGTMCEQLAQYNDGADKDTVARSCQAIEDLIVRLKAMNDLTEAQRNEYNQLLTGITERIIHTAKMTKDKQLATKIESYRLSMERDLNIVRNKNIKLNAGKTKAEITAQQARRERDAAIAAQQTAEATLAQYRAEHSQPQLSALEQQRLTQLQTEVERTRHERDAAIAAQKKMEGTQNDLKRALEQAISTPQVTPPAATKPTFSAQAPVAIPTPAQTAPSQIPPMTIPQLKQNLQQRFSLISPSRRAREEREQLRQFFASTSNETIYTDNNTYSIDSYWDKLSLLGPYDVHITDIKTDIQGKIMSMKIEETRLGE